MIIPKHIHIEVVSSICTADCIMCVKNDWKRKPHIISDEVFDRIITQFSPYKEQIEMVSLFGHGEPLLDSKLPARIQKLKANGFSGIGIASNCSELYEKKSYELLESRLDTLICSVDGITAETHEGIRKNLNYSVILNNILEFIKIRSELKQPTKLILRFYSMEQNKHEWPEYKSYWLSKLSSEFGDMVIYSVCHNWHGEIENNNISLVNRKQIKGFACQDLWEKMFIKNIK